jgi:hypothetical protein
MPANGSPQTSRHDRISNRQTLAIWHEEEAKREATLRKGRKRAGKGRGQKLDHAMRLFNAANLSRRTFPQG